MQTGDGEVDVLATGAALANGVVVVDAASWEGRRQRRHERSSRRRRRKRGGVGMRAKRVLDGFPGLLDGSDCSFDRGMCYVPIPATVLAPMSAVFSGGSCGRC